MKTVSGMVREIAPILVKHCLDCHGTDAKGGLRLDTFAGLEKGGKSGALLVIGDAAMLVDLFHGARKRADDGSDFGHGADRRDASGEAGALEVARDLVAHDLGLLAHLERKRIGAVGRGLVEHDRDRRLQRVC